MWDRGHKIYSSIKLYSKIILADAYLIEFIKHFCKQWTFHMRIIPNLSHKHLVVLTLLVSFADNFLQPGPRSGSSLSGLIRIQTA